MTASSPASTMPFARYRADESPPTARSRVLLGVPRGRAPWAGHCGRSAAAPCTRVPWHRVVGAGGRISLRGGSGPFVQRQAAPSGRGAVPRRADRAQTLRAASRVQTRLTRGSLRISRARCRRRRSTACSREPASTRAAMARGRPVDLGLQGRGLLDRQGLHRGGGDLLVDLAELAPQVLPVGLGGHRHQVLHVEELLQGQGEATGAAARGAARAAPPASPGARAGSPARPRGRSGSAAAVLAAASSSTRRRQKASDDAFGSVSKAWSIPTRTVASGTSASCQPWRGRSRGGRARGRARAGPGALSRWPRRRREARRPLRMSPVTPAPRRTAPGGGEGRPGP